MEKIVSNDTFTRPKKTGQVKFIPQQPGGSPAMFFQFTLAWSKIRPTRLRRRLHASGGSAAAAVRQAREVGGSGQNLAKKGCTCTRKRAGEFRPFRYTSLSVRSAAAWRFDGFFSNGEWRHHRPLGYARPWRQTPFFVSLFRLLLFFLLFGPPSFFCL